MIFQEDYGEFFVDNSCLRGDFSILGMMFQIKQAGNFVSLPITYLFIFSKIFVSTGTTCFFLETTPSSKAVLFDNVTL